MAPISKEMEDYIRESIEDSVGLPISGKTLKLKLLASEEDRRLLQDQNFMLHDRLKEIHMRFQSCKEEASMNARGLKKCIKEKETVLAKYAETEKYCAKLKKKCMLFERELDKSMEYCDELEKENYELRAQLQDISSDKELLLKKLQRAEEEVKLLYKENRSLDEENKQLQRKLQREQRQHRSEHKNSTKDSSSRGKRKLRHAESNHCAGETDVDLDERSRHLPHSPLYKNSSQSKRLKQ